MFSIIKTAEIRGCNICNISKKGDEIPKYLVKVSDGLLAKFGCDVEVIGATIKCKTSGPVIQIVQNDESNNEWKIHVHAHKIIGCGTDGINSGINWTCTPCKMIPNCL